jgi:hypothetical protein
MKKYLLGLSYFIIGTGIFFWTDWPGLVIYTIGYLVGILLGYEIR